MNEADLLKAVSEKLDPDLVSAKFQRARDSLAYTRRIMDVSQRIELALERGPADEPEAVAALYPWLEVRVPAAEALLGAQAHRIILRQPIELTSDKKSPARWLLMGKESLRRALDELAVFLRAYSLPLLDEYCTLEAIHRLANDPRLLNTYQKSALAVLALVLLGRKDAATARAEECFGGARQRFSWLFDALKYGRA